MSVENGDISYSDRFLVGSVASYTCDTGFELQPPCNNTRTCTPSGWTNQDYTCTSKSSVLIYKSIHVASVASYHLLVQYRI